MCNVVACSLMVYVLSKLFYIFCTFSWRGFQLVLSHHFQSHDHFPNYLATNQRIFFLLYCQKVLPEENFASFANWSFIHEIKFLQKMFFRFIREIKFLQKKTFSSFTKLNSSNFFFFPILSIIFNFFLYDY